MVEPNSGRTQQTNDFYCDFVFNGSVAVKKVMETSNVLAYHHTKPSWTTHIVIVPKRHIAKLTDLAEMSLIQEIFQVANDIIKKYGFANSNFKIVTNGGNFQDSHHLHFHLLSGEKINAMNQQLNMRKLLSPIIYFAFLLPVLFSTIRAISLIENTIGLSRFWRVGFLEIIFVVTVLGGGVFWLANLLIEKFEKNNVRTMADHLRQSVLYYFVAAGVFLSFLFRDGFHGGLSEAVTFIIGITCLWAVAVNFVYSFWRIIYGKWKISREARNDVCYYYGLR